MKALTLSHNLKAMEALTSSHNHISFQKQKAVTLQMHPWQMCMLDTKFSSNIPQHHNQNKTAKNKTYAYFMGYISHHPYDT